MNPGDGIHDAWANIASLVEPLDEGAAGRHREAIRLPRRCARCPVIGDAPRPRPVATADMMSRSHIGCSRLKREFASLGPQCPPR